MILYSFLDEQMPAVLTQEKTLTNSHDAKILISDFFQHE